MWTDNALESEGAYAVSSELLNTIRHIYESNGKEGSKYFAWYSDINAALCSVFEGSNLVKFKKEATQELEALMGLIRGCEYLGLMPYCKAEVIESGERKREKMIKVLGFVNRKWLTYKTIDWALEETRIHQTMQDTNQKVLAV